MSVAFRAAASVTNGTAGTSVVVSRPTGTVPGDQLVAFVAAPGNGTLTGPAGWVLIGTIASTSNVTMKAYRFVATASDPASWTWSLGVSVRNWGWIGAYSGVDTSNPIYASGSASVDAGGTVFQDGVLRMPQFGLGVSAAAAVRTASGTATTWTPSGAERADLSTNGGTGTDIAGEVQDSQNSTSGITSYGPFLTASQSQTAGVVLAFTLNPYWQLPDLGDPVSSTVEVALNGGIGIDPATWTWTDVTQRAKGTARIERGRINWTDQTQPSQYGMRFDNTDSWLTPRHPASPWRNQWGVGTPIRHKVNLPIGSFIRFQGYVDSIAPDFPAGDDSVAMVNVTASGVLRTLNLPGVPALSSMQRAVLADGPLEYWPMNDGSNATVVASANGGSPMVFSQTAPSFGASGPPGGGSMLSLGSTTLLAGQVRSTTNTSAWTLELVFKIPSAPASNTTVLEWSTNGTLPLWRFTYFTSGPALGIEAWNAAGTQVISGFTTTFTSPLAYNSFILLDIAARQNGGNIEYEFQTMVQTGTDGTGSGSGNFGGSVAGTLGTVLAVDVPAVGDHTGWVVGHLSVWDKSLDSSFGFGGFPHYNAFVGYTGDFASFRISREATAAGISSTTVVRPDTGFSANGVVMGAELVASPVANMRDAETADIGLLSDGLGPGLNYLPGQSRFNWPIGMALDASRNQVKLPFLPVEDDQRRKDKITVSRNSGSSVTVGSGNYPDAVTLNVLDDSSLDDQANFRRGLGTIPEMRVPSLVINLRSNPELIQSWVGLDLGYRYTATNLPSQFPPGVLDQVLEHYVETIDAVTWSVEMTGSPFAPWRAFTIEDPSQGRFDTAGSQLTAAVAPSASSMTVETTSGPLWITTAGRPAKFPFDVDVGGWQVTVTSVTNTVTDVFGRTVSSGFGSADSGQAYTTSGGSAADYSVSGGTGRISNGSRNVVRFVTLDTGQTDVSLTVDCQFGVGTPTGGVMDFDIYGRLTGTNNGYFAELEAGTSGVVTARLWKQVSGGFTALTSASNVGTNNLGDFWRVTLNITGTSITATAQNITTPTAMVMLTATDSSIATGTLVGWLSFLASGNTNTLPVVSQFDNLAVTNPQVFTVNSTPNTTTIPTGTAVKLWRPSAWTF